MIIMILSYDVSLCGFSPSQHNILWASGGLSPRSSPELCPRISLGDFRLPRHPASAPPKPKSWICPWLLLEYYYYYYYYYYFAIFLTRCNRPDFISPDTVAALVKVRWTFVVLMVA